MAQPNHIIYPESKTHPKEVAVAQSNVYKVVRSHLIISIISGPKGLEKKVPYNDNSMIIDQLYYKPFADNAGVLEGRSVQASHL